MKNIDELLKDFNTSPIPYISTNCSKCNVNSKDYISVEILSFPKLLVFYFKDIFETLEYPKVISLPEENSTFKLYGIVCKGKDGIYYTVSLIDSQWYIIKQNYFYCHDFQSPAEIRMLIYKKFI